jgi:hypothetical protein
LNQSFISIWETRGATKYFAFYEITKQYEYEFESKFYLKLGGLKLDKVGLFFYDNVFWYVLLGVKFG